MKKGFKRKQNTAYAVLVQSFQWDLVGVNAKKRMFDPYSKTRCDYKCKLISKSLHLSPPFIIVLTLYLLVLSADNFRKQFGPRSDPTERQVYPGPKLLKTLMVFPKTFFEKMFLTEISRRQKCMKNYTGCK